jgi:hypothetical protein
VPTGTGAKRAVGPGRTKAEAYTKKNAPSPVIRTTANIAAGVHVGFPLWLAARALRTPVPRMRKRLNPSSRWVGLTRASSETSRPRVSCHSRSRAPAVPNRMIPTAVPR